MAVVYFHEWPGKTTAMAQGVSDGINAQLGSAIPEGAIFHAEGGPDGAWWSFDVWESEDAAQRFYNEILQPATEAEGAPQGQMRALPIHWHSLETPSAAG